MKSKKLFKKAVSLCMAALVSVSTVFPVYAADMNETMPAAGTDESQEQTEGSGTDVQETSVDGVEKLVSETGNDSDGEAELYAVCLPKTDAIQYSYDESHLDTALSEQLSMHVLVYEENENFEMNV